MSIFSAMPIAKRGNAGFRLIYICMINKLDFMLYKLYLIVP